MSARTADRPPDDEGFTLIEVMVALGIIGTLMTSLTTFFISTNNITNYQSLKQTAVVIAGDGLERVRSIKGSELIRNRDETSTHSQWNSASTAVRTRLNTTNEVWDGTADYPAGATAPLPTTPETVTLNGLKYQRSWYVGSCYQDPDGGDCTAAVSATRVMFYRVVVAVTWPDRHCGGTSCSYLTSTLVSAAAYEPVFNANETAKPPAVTNPGDQVGEYGFATSLQLTATGGAPPLTWAAVGLPSGLEMASNGLVTGTPDLPGVYAVVVTATDAFHLIGSAAFKWTVNAWPKLKIDLQSTAGGVPVRIVLTLTGGTGPYVWSAKPGKWGSTGLPPGLSLNAATGEITGTPTLTGQNDVSLEVTDAYGKIASATFGWIVPTFGVTNPGAQTLEEGETAALQLQATGGIVPYTWSATGLPNGLSINSLTGKITGVPTKAGSYSVTVTTKDAFGLLNVSPTTVTTTFTWTITPGPTITAPPAVRVDAVGASVSIQSTVSGGTAPFTWSATNLPPGLTVNASSGLISGTPTRGTRYLTTLTVTDAKGVKNSELIAWTVSPLVKGLTITMPATDRSSARGTAVSVVSAATGGSATGYVWTVSGLPTGLTMTSAGKITGTPSTAGSYTVTLTVTDSVKNQATAMFVWTIT